MRCLSLCKEPKRSKTLRKTLNKLALMAAILIAAACGNNGDPAIPTTPKTFTITFNSKGGNIVNPQTISEGGKVIEPQGVIKNRNTLYAWYRDEDLNSVRNFSTDTVTNDLILYAKWNLDTSLIAADFGSHTIDLIFEVENIGEWNAAIESIQTEGGGKNYFINVNNNITIDPSTRVFGNVSNIKIAIWGDKEISFSSPGILFAVRGIDNQVLIKQTVILRDITLRGRPDNINNFSFVSVWYSSIVSL